MKLGYKYLLLFPLFLFTSLLFFSAHNSVYALEKIEVTTVDPQATGYGTFQSHNQKVVANQYGIFMTHLHDRNEAYDHNTWRLSRSTDGGKTFSTIYESANGTSAPVIETDTQGNIYLAHPDWGIGYTQTYGLFYIFTPGNNFTNPIKVSQIPDCADGKYSMVFDKSRSQFYFFSNKNTFTIIGMNGEIKTSYKLTASGNSAYLMYPNLYLDSNNDLYAAWTTQKFGEYMYWDIHFMLSKDGGITWQKPNGQTLTPPVVSDQTGPTDRITLDDEFNVFTWLWTLIVKNGKVHFAYMAQFPSPNYRQHYVRYDLATAQKDLDIYPDWKGETISLLNLDGFCATHASQPDFPMYCISRTRDSHLGVLVSYDNGQNWHDYAQSDFNDQNLYSIGGAREVTADGYIIGSYTDARTDNAVRFFKIKAISAPPPPLQSASFTNNTITVTFNNPYATISDWIGFYNPPTLADSAWGQNWKWLNNTKTQSSTPITSGTVTFTPPASGTYDVRYFYTGANQKIDSKTVSVTLSFLPGDLDKNGKIDIFDYNLMIQNFGNTTCGNVADIDGNCNVNIFDYNTLVQNFGR